MKERITVQMIGAPIGVCSGKVEDAWRNAAQLVAHQLEHYFGDQIEVQYFDLLDANCPTLPPNTQLPLVLVEGHVLSSGGKSQRRRCGVT